MFKQAKNEQKEVMKKLKNDYKSIDKNSALQKKPPPGKHLNYAAGKIPLNTLTAQDKIMHRQNSNKRIIFNDPEKRKSETINRAKKQPDLAKALGETTDERKNVGNIAFVTKRGEPEPETDEVDLLSDLDDEEFEAELELSLAEKTKIMKEEMDRKAALDDLDKQQRDLLKGIVDKKKRLGSAIQRQPLLMTTNTRIAAHEEVKDMDSSLDSEEFDAEMRDKVKAEGVNYDSDEEEFTNTDLKYYDKMDPVDKLQTLNNRTKALQDKQKEMFTKLK